MAQVRVNDIIRADIGVNLLFRIVYDNAKQELALLSPGGYISIERVSRPFGKHYDPLKQSELEYLWGGSVKNVVNEHGELLFPEIKYYQTGQRFKSDMTGNEYILAATGDGESNFINLETGWRYSDSIKNTSGKIKSDQVPAELIPI